MIGIIQSWKAYTIVRQLRYPISVSMTSMASMNCLSKYSLKQSPGICSSQLISLLLVFQLANSTLISFPRAIIIVLAQQPYITRIPSLRKEYPAKGQLPTTCTNSYKNYIDCPRICEFFAMQLNNTNNTVSEPLVMRLIKSCGQGFEVSIKKVFSALLFIINWKC